LGKEKKRFGLRYLYSFIMTFSCIYVLYLELVHPLHFSSFYLSSVMVIIVSLKTLCSFLYRKYTTHITFFLLLLPLPY
jgi:hypothetical protein